MKIDQIIIPVAIRHKLTVKHQVMPEEAKYALLNRPRIRFAERGQNPGEDVYAAFGRTASGRYLSVFFVYKPVNRTAIIISARSMSGQERKQYGRK